MNYDVRQKQKANRRARKRLADGFDEQDVSLAKWREIEALRHLPIKPTTPPES